IGFSSLDGRADEFLNIRRRQVQMNKAFGNRPFTWVGTAGQLLRAESVDQLLCAAADVLQIVIDFVPRYFHVLLPLNRTGRLRGDIINHAVDAANLIYDAV